jgi:hypothetical protein
MMGILRFSGSSNAFKVWDSDFVLAGTVKDSANAGIAASVAVYRNCDLTDTKWSGETNASTGAFSIPVPLNTYDVVLVVVVPEDTDINAMAYSQVVPVAS